MIRNNLWNRIFHRREVSEIRKQLFLNQQAILVYDKLEFKLRNCTELLELLDIHKLMWSYNYRNANLGPCSYGMFRTTDSIEHMSPDEVYLGDIYGLATNNITFWESHKNEKFGDNGFGLDPEISMYALLVAQYKRLLIANLHELYAAFVKFQIAAETVGFNK
jgi:hypothetical protein